MTNETKTGSRVRTRNEESAAIERTTDAISDGLEGRAALPFARTTRPRALAAPIAHLGHRSCAPLAANRSAAAMAALLWRACGISLASKPNG